MMLPVFWDEEAADESGWAMDTAQLDGIMLQNRQEYLDMSWGKMTVEHAILQQQAFGVSKETPSWDDTSAAAKRLLNVDLGFEQGVDYDAVGLVYHLANDGPFSDGGGWGCLNCDFLWMSYQLVSVPLRAEICGWRHRFAELSRRRSTWRSHFSC